MFALNKVLIIEDNEMNLQMAKELLVYEGVETFEAEDGEVGLELANHIAPNLILLDLNLPNKNGYEVLNELRSNEQTKDIVVLAFTAMLMEADINKIQGSGFDGLISKPINVINFADTVKSYYPRPGNAVQAPLNSAKTEPIPSVEMKPVFKIMIVDDSSINATLLRDIIEPLGHQLMEALSGEQALELLHQQKPDLILLDIMMPGMDGYELLKRIKQEPETADIMVVFVSALAESKDIIAGLDKGAYDYISKPVKPDEVQARVKAALRTKELQDELHQQKSEAVTAKQDLEQFLFIASHDLQAPLRKILQFDTFLKEACLKYDDAEMMGYIESIDRNAITMETLIASLLILSRIERNGAHFEQFDLGQLIENVVASCGAIEKSCFQLDCDRNVLIHGDREQISQAINILIDNAYKFRKPELPFVLNISCKSVDHNRCEVTVSDNGIGFDEKHKERIFKPLERLHGASKYPGMGMGLAILKKIIDRHAGAVDASSKPGEGASFRLSLALTH